MLLLLIIGSFSIAFLLAWGLNWLALIPWRRSIGKHWSERARVLYSARVSCAVNVFLIPANVVLAQCFVEPSLSACWPTLAFITCLCALLGTYSFQREIFPQLTFKLWLNQICAGWPLRYGSLFVYLGCAVMMPEEFGWQALAIAAGALMFHLGQLSQWRVKLMLWLRLLLPADQRLRHIVVETSSRMGIPVVGVWRLTGIHAQAYALPVTRELLFSERLMEICDDREVSSICAHELGHLAESKAVLFRRVVATFAFFPLLFIKPAFFSGSPFAALLLVPTLVLLLLVRKLPIRMEKRADKMAVENQGEPGVYGRALEKIYQENIIPAVSAGNRQTHPHLYDRLLAAGITPDYLRPKPAKKYQWSSIVLYVSLVIGFLVYLNLPDSSYLSAFLSISQP